MFEKTKQFVKDNAVEIISWTAVVGGTAFLTYSNLRLSANLESTKQYAQAAVRALSAVDQAARQAGVPEAQLNTLIQTAGLAIKESVK